MKKRVLAAALAIVIAFGVTGCGTNKNNTGKDGKVKLVLWDGFPYAKTTDADKAVMKYWETKVAEKFPNYTIKRESSAGGDYLANYDKALMAGTAPAAFSNMPYVSVPLRMENGTIADLTDFYNNWEDKGKEITYFDEAIISKDGKHYAIPRSAYVMGTTYNKKTIKAGGGDPTKLPKTWKEFAELGQKLTDKSVPRIGYELVGMSFAAWPFTAWVWSAGGEMVEKKKNGKYKISFNEAEGVDAAMFLNEMVWKYNMTQKDILQGFDKILSDVKAGTAAFAWADMSSMSNADLKTYGNLTLDDFGIMPMPVKNKKIKNPGFAGGEVITLNPKNDEATMQAAWNYMTYMFYDDEYLEGLWKVNEKYQTGSMQMPAKKDHYKKMLDIYTNVPEQLKKDTMAIRDIAKAEPFCPHWNDLKEALVVPLQTILLDEHLTRAKAQKLLDDCAKELYSTYPDTFEK